MPQTFIDETSADAAAAGAGRRRPFTFDRTVRILVSVCAVLATIYLLNLLKGVLLPFLVACLLAYMLEPIVQWNMKWTHSRRRFLPVMLALVETAVVIAGISFAVIPYIVSEAQEMTVMLRNYTTSHIQIPYISERVHQLLRDNIDFNSISNLFTREEWYELGKKTLAYSWTVVSSSLAYIFGLFSWLIVILYVIFIMLDYERLMLSFRQLVPVQHRRRTFAIASDIKNAMNRYFRGQFVIAFTVGILFSIGFMIIGLPMGILLGLFIGMLNMVPYLQLISLPMTAMLCLVYTASGGGDFWVIFWESMAVYVVVQCIQDLVLTPKVMGKAMGLNPAIILLSLSIWGSLLGFMGMIIALPLTTLVLSYYDQYVVNAQARPAVEDALDDPTD